MCRININNINISITEGLSIASVKARYKKTDATNWTYFEIDLNGINMTPDISENGFYYLELQVIDSLNNNSGWIRNNFSITENCDNFNNE